MSLMQICVAFNPLANLCNIFLPSAIRRMSSARVLGGGERRLTHHVALVGVYFPVSYYHDPGAVPSRLRGQYLIASIIGAVVGAYYRSGRGIVATIVFTIVAVVGSYYRSGCGIVATVASTCPVLIILGIANVSALYLISTTYT